MNAARSMDQRNRELAAIHVARKQLGLDEETYRSTLQLVAGVRSAKDLSDDDRQRVLDHFRRMGFDRARGRRNNSANKQHSKIRYLWRDLYRAGAIKDNTDAALDSYVCRMTGVASLRFLGFWPAHQLIESMKQWLSRYE